MAIKRAALHDEAAAVVVDALARLKQACQRRARMHNLAHLAYELGRQALNLNVHLDLDRNPTEFMQRSGRVACLQGEAAVVCCLRWSTLV